MRPQNKQTIYVTALFIALPVLLAVTITAFKNRFDKLPVYGDPGVKQGTHFIGAFNLKQQDEKMFSLNDVKDKIIVADFFFTSCTSVCPKMTMHLKTAADAFKTDTTIAFISFTVDPETDNPQRLKDYMKQFDIDNSQWNFLTGDKREIYKLARKDFFLTASDGDGGPNDFIHSDKLVLIDKEKRIRGYYTGIDDGAIKKLIQDIKKLQHEK